MPAKPKLTDAKIEQVIGALRGGADLTIAAAVVGVSKQAIEKRMRNNEEFRERVDDARAFADERVVRSLFKAATEKNNVVAMIFWLKNRRPKEWRDRREFFDGDGSMVQGAVIYLPDNGRGDTKQAEEEPA